MAMMAARNALQSPALSDLGLGDLVKQQLEDQLEEQKKTKLLAAAKPAGGPGQEQMGMGALQSPQGLAAKFANSPMVQTLFGGKQ
jgi:hypothetical protein